MNSFLSAVEQSEHCVMGASDGPLRVGVDLGTAFIVLTVLDGNRAPVAMEKQYAHALRDGVVLDSLQALEVVRALKTRLETRLGRSLTHASIAMPSGTEASVRIHRYVVEGAGMEVTAVLDEPTAANAIYQITNGAVVDVGGGTTGIAVFRNGEVVSVYDEPTGGEHLTLVIAGNRRIPFEQAEALKTDPKRHIELLPVVTPVLQKMSTIVKRHLEGKQVDSIYLCGGTACFAGIERVFEFETGLKTIKLKNPILVTPTGIAWHCPEM